MRVPGSDAEVPAFLADLGVPGIVDVHAHFLPDAVMAKVWAYFDRAETHYGTPWPVHVQVGRFDPRDPLLTPAWGLLADAGVPAVVHCGHGPVPGPRTGLHVFAEVLHDNPARLLRL